MKRRTELGERNKGWELQDLQAGCRNAVLQQREREELGCLRDTNRAPGLRGVGRETVDSEGLGNLYKVTQRVKGQRQDLNPGMAGTTASTLLSYTYGLSSRQ